MLADNLHNVKETIASALARRTERKETGDEVCLVAVTIICRPIRQNRLWNFLI